MNGTSRTARLARPIQYAFVALLFLLLLAAWGLGGAGTWSAAASSSFGTGWGQVKTTVALPACAPDWQVVSSPNRAYPAEFFSVAAVSADDVWAVGYYDTAPNGGYSPLTEHWNGTQWSIVPNPGQPGYILYSVAAVSSTDVWAAGAYISRQGTFTEHWNGTQWSVVSSPNPGSGHNALLSVAAVSSNDVWAVGVYLNYSDSVYRTLTEHWDGAQWSVVPSPNRGTNYGDDNELYSVAAVSSTDVWAAGNYQANGLGEGTLTEHWDGTSWSIVSSPNQGSGGNYLYSVAAGSANDVWAVGYYSAAPGVDETLAEHWDGTSWNIVAGPGLGNRSYLQSVVVVSSNDVWAVGYHFITYVGLRTLTEHWDGSQWSIVSSPNQGTGDNYLYSIAAFTSDDIWAAGSSTDVTLGGTLAEHWDGASWSIVPGLNPSTANNTLNSVSAVSSTDVWAVGNGALIEHWDGTSWNIVASPNPGNNNNDLQSVAAVSSNDVWVVGYYAGASGADQTLTEHWDGASWSFEPSPNIGAGENRLYSVAAVSPNDVWAVGYYYNGITDQTLVEHWDGTAWSFMGSPNQGPNVNLLYSVAAVSANDVWAVGAYITDGLADQTLVEHWDGTAWSIVSSTGPGSFVNDLYSVATISSDNVWAVGTYSDGSGYQTLVEHWDGTAWNIVTSPNPSTTNQLWSVAAVSSTEVWAVGYYNNGSVDQTLVERYNPCPSTPTPTETVAPPTSTPTDTPSNTPVAPTATNTSIPATAISTPIPPTDTPTITNTPLPPTATPTQVAQGCTSSFWQGALGVTLWDQVNDPDWTAHSGTGTNPYETSAQFNGFFAPYPGFGSMTMLQILGTSGKNNPARKAARDAVAAYLNASFGLNYPYSAAQIAGMWASAVNTNNFKPLYNLLDAANSQQCPIQ